MIQEHIEFARQNELIIDGHQVTDFDLSNDKGDVLLHQTDTNFYQNTIELITSKEFIEAIARGKLQSKKFLEYIIEGHCSHLIDTLKEADQEYRDGIFLYKAIDWITDMQARAIRDNTLDDFIKKILPKK